MQRNRARIPGAIAVLLFAALSCSFAQILDEDEDYPRVATLIIFSRPGAETQVSFYSYVAIDDMPGVRAALNSALRCDLSAPQITHYTAQQIPDPERRRLIEKSQARLATRELRGTCPGQLHHNGLRSSLDLPLGDVLAQLRANKIETLTITISYYDLYNLQVGARKPLSSSHGMVTFQLPVATDSGAIHLDWGYQKSDLISPLFAAALFVLLPCSVILWMRSRALHLHSVDRAGAWFSYIRTQHLCTNAALLLWIGGGYSMRSLFANILTSAYGQHSTRAAAASIAYFILPPMTVLAVSAVASYRVMTDVRQVAWRFRDFFGLQVAQLGTIMIPILGVYSGIQLMDRLPWVSWGIIIAAFCSLPLAIYLRRRLTGRYPE
ncbi:MAG TPA: hypothetical protein VFU86_20135, partial [Terriglobales bacterium]|nr:hypothetical protein [Terriglobales bacterium]